MSSVDHDLMPPSEDPAPDPTVPDGLSAHDWLEAEILSGRLPPGSRIMLDALAERRSVTPSEMREAAIQLSNDGLAFLDGGASLRVAPVSLADLKDLTATRIVVEKEVLRSSILAADADWEARVRAAFGELSAVEALLGDNPRAHLDRWERCNGEFHGALVAACPLRRLMRFNRLLYKQHERYRRLVLVQRTTPRDVHAEHLALFEAAIARDVEAACAVLEEHIARTVDMLANGIRDGSWFGASAGLP
ncbi:MAG TPA: GntR family transcriptional regulator [Azospirillum sp.]|nr:GntR family transcriptional regulator [Azospirillum sp.]